MQQLQIYNNDAKALIPNHRVILYMHQNRSTCSCNSELYKKSFMGLLIGGKPHKNCLMMLTVTTKNHGLSYCASRISLQSIGTG